MDLPNFSRSFAATTFTRVKTQIVAVRARNTCREQMFMNGNCLSLTSHQHSELFLITAAKIIPATS